MPPVPVTAIVNGPVTLINITFDKPLVADPAIDTANWAVRWNNIGRTVTGGLTTGSKVTLSLVAGGADVGIDRVNFAPPPNDVIDAITGLAVVPFTDFPVTM